MYHKDMFIEYIMRTSAESDRVDRDFKRSMGNPSSLYTWKNPATERVFQLLIGEMPCIHSVKKSSSHSNTASESSLSKTLGVSYRNALQFVHSVWGDDSSPALTPHSPLWRQGQRQECPETLKTGPGSGGLPFVTNPLDSLHKFKSTTRWPTTQPPSLAWSPSPLSFQPLWSTFSPSLPTYLSWRKQRLLKTERQTETTLMGQIMNTQDLLVLIISFGTACFALNIYKLNQEPQQ